MRFDAAAIAAATGGRLVQAPPTAEPGPLSTDSRQIGPGDWFLAIVGERFDAHDFLGQVRERGCAGVVAQRVPAGWDRGFVQVDDTLVALQDLGRAARRAVDCPVIGITGSAGKTTTRAMVAVAIGAVGEVYTTAGNLNNHIGVPLTLLAAPRDCAAMVVELGMSGFGEIDLLQEISAPDIRLITNVGAAHLEGVGSLEGVARAKGELFAGARPGDVCIVNADDPYVRELPVPEGARVLRYGRSPASEVRLVEATIDPVSLATAFTVRIGGQTVSATLPSPGLHLAMNGAAALAVAHVLGLDLADAARRLSAYRPVGMRLRIEEGPGEISVINDAYNANPVSVKASVGTLGAMAGRRIAVLGDMLELGSYEAVLHEDCLQHAILADLDILALVGPRFTAAARRLGVDLLHAESPEALAPLLAPLLLPGDLVLLKGSRGIGVERLLGALAAPES